MLKLVKKRESNVTSGTNLIFKVKQMTFLTQTSVVTKLMKQLINLYILINTNLYFPHFPTIFSTYTFILLIQYFIFLKLDF